MFFLLEHQPPPWPGTLVPMVNRLVGKRRPYNQLHSFKTATFIFSKFEHFWISKARPAPSSTVANQCILLYSYFKLFYLSVNSCIDKRLNSARGSGTGLVTVGPAKVKACKSVLFTEVAHDVEIKTTWLMKLTHFIWSHFAWLLYAVAKYLHSTFTQ